MWKLINLHRNMHGAKLFRQNLDFLLCRDYNNCLEVLLDPPENQKMVCLACFSLDKRKLKRTLMVFASNEFAFVLQRHH